MQPKLFTKETFEADGKKFEKKYGKDTAYIWIDRKIKKWEVKWL